MAIADVDFGEFAGMEDLMVDLFETVFDPEVMKELKKDGKGQEVKSFSKLVIFNRLFSTILTSL